MSEFIGTKLTMNLGERSYDIIVKSGSLENLYQFARLDRRVAVVTDSGVPAQYAQMVADQCKDAHIITVPQGEASKSFKILESVLRQMLEFGMGRGDLVIAVGGGVVGDLAGFVASTYMRGVTLVQAPTTLLSMVDSSVGGKTGVNLTAGKNLVGTFKQPAYVCADTGALYTLPEREWACGCAEVAKSAVIDSDEFFFWLAEAAGALAERDEAVVAEAIARCVVFKADVVAEDKAESRGVRECLNYGHTLGHAVEALAGYGAFSHGAAVAEGMRFAARLAAALAGAPLEFVAAQDDLLDALGLPALAWSAEPADMLAAMKRDKKARHGQVRFVLPRDGGSWERRDVDDAVILEHLEAWARSKEALS